MLQQTRTEAVKGYFRRFIEELPTISALAACPPDRLMKLWEGLGYYSRVRCLQKAAGQLCTASGASEPKLPASAAELRRLPGFGPYTAGAVASIAFGECVPAVDGNALRIYSRLCADGSDIAQECTKKAFTAAYQAILSDENRQAHCVPGIFNQALMDLGACICLPKNPKCAECPLAPFCKAYAAGTQDNYPVKGKAKARKAEARSVLLLRCGEYTAIRKRPPGGMLASLWEFPNAPGAWEYCAEAMGLPPGDILSAAPAGQHTHIFTHREWVMQAWEIKLCRCTALPGLLWVTDKELESYAIPSAFAWCKRSGGD
jgi:A/G-specific adenine glycosylase